MDAADAGPVPAALVAVTLKVYVVPFVKVVTDVVVAGGDPRRWWPSGPVAPMNGVTV